MTPTLYYLTALESTFQGPNYSLPYKLYQGRIDPNGKRACNSRIDSANGKIQMRPPDILFLDVGM